MSTGNRKTVSRVGRVALFDPTYLFVEESGFALLNPVYRNFKPGNRCGQTLLI